MKKSMKDEFERRYDITFRKLYINWMERIDREYQILKENGLNTSGHAISIMYDTIEKLVEEIIECIDNMIGDINNTFDIMPLKDLYNYIEKSKKDLNGHINSMQEKVLEKFDDDKLMSNETSRIKIQNIRKNAEYKLNQIYLKYKNIKGFKKIEWIVLVNMIATVGSFIISMITFLKN